MGRIFTLCKRINNIRKIIINNFDGVLNKEIVQIVLEVSMNFKHLEKKIIFKNDLLCIKEELLELPNGKQAIWNMIVASDAVAILAVTDEDKVLLVKQYRPAVKNKLLEVPSGIIDEGESPEEAAFRELEEETGYRAEKLEKLGTFYTSPGFSHSQLHLYKAFNLIKTQQDLDDAEFLEVIEINKNKINNLNIEDIKTKLILSYL